MSNRGLFHGQSFAVKFLSFAVISIFAFIISAALVLVFHPASSFAIKWMQSIFSLTSFVLPALILIYIFEKEPVYYILKLKTLPKLNVLVLTFISMIVVYPFIILLAGLNQSIPFPDYIVNASEANQKLVLELLAGNRLQDLIINLLFIAVVPAITEEVYFRGFVQQFIAKHFGIYWGIWAVAAFFSMYHMDLLGFIPRMLLGAYLGYLFYWSKSIWLPIFAHLVNNGFQICLYFFFYEKMQQVENIEAGAVNVSLIIVGLISLALFTPLMFRIKNQSENKTIA